VAKLELEYSPDDEWDGGLWAFVESNGYSGKGHAWGIDRQTITDKFLRALRIYPIPTESPPLLKAEIFGQCHLRIAVSPFNAVGHLLVRVDLTTDFDFDRELQCSATVRFLTEYALLDRFADELERVLEGRRDVATLEGVK